MRLDVNQGCHSGQISPRMNTSTRTKLKVQPFAVLKQKREFLSHQIIKTSALKGVNASSNSPQSRSGQHVWQWLMKYLVNQDVISDLTHRSVSLHELSEPMFLPNKFREFAHGRSPS